MERVLFTDIEDNDELDKSQSTIASNDKEKGKSPNKKRNNSKKREDEVFD